MKLLIASIMLLSIISMILILSAFQNDIRPPISFYINDISQTATKNNSLEESIDTLDYYLSQALADMDEERRNNDLKLMFFLLSVICIIAIISISLCLYCERNFFMPFRKLQNFAHHIAAGNLDIPLEMNKRNMFGAFTESFDLMREELRIAKENEYKANQQKKELVASLSHDIKTPIASIMSAMDIMLVKAIDENEKERIESVNIRLEQINNLVTNMFQATLEELQALIVLQCEIQSVEISTLIKNADYENKVLSFSIPNCIILADPLRLQQVFDNIIHNSYKYADTDISINSSIDGNYLIIDIQDFGGGVLDEEIPLVFNKFYRGKNSDNIDGYGLGLYLSKYFMEQMSGSLYCENKVGSFIVTLTLSLAGLS